LYRQKKKKWQGTEKRKSKKRDGKKGRPVSENTCCLRLHGGKENSYERKGLNIIKREKERAHGN